MMYLKLLLRNARRSAKDYLIYIVTLTLCTTMFYSFLSITSKYYKPDLGVSYNIDMLSDGMKMAICFITLFLLFLIKYVNTYMIRRRQKEFAIHTMMGMEQKTTALLFFAETMVMGMLSLLAGILLGALVSQWITAMLMTCYGKPFQLTWSLFPDTIILTLVFFLLSFSFIGIGNIRTIRKTKIISMLYAEKENEPDFRQSKWMPVITFIYILAICLMLATGITKMRINFDFRFALPVHILFWGNILIPATGLAGTFLWAIRKKRRKFSRLVFTLLAIAFLNLLFTAAVPVLQIKYYLSLDAESLNIYMMFLLTDLIYIVCGIFYFASNAIIIGKERSLKWKYKEENLFFFGQILTKLKSTTKSMILVCLTLAVSISIFFTTPVLSGWANGYLDKRAVYDIQIYSMYHDVYDTADLPSNHYGFVGSFLEENKITVKDDCSFRLYLPRAKDFYQRNKNHFPVTAISLSDYNHLRKMRGYAPIALDGNQFTTQWNSIADADTRQEFLESTPTVSTDAGLLTLAGFGPLDASLGITLYNSYTDVSYVFPDKICEKLLSVNRNRYITTTKALSYQTANALEKKFTKELPETEEGAFYSIRTSTVQINSLKASNFIMQTALTYGAIILLIICFTILALQQLYDANQYPYRFLVLRRLGVEECQVSRLIIRQLAVTFGLPIGTAAIIAGVFLFYLWKTLSLQITAYVGKEMLFSQLGAITVLLMALTLCYFAVTWILFRHTISNSRP